MKNVALALSLVFCCSLASGQSLTELAKKGVLSARLRD